MTQKANVGAFCITYISKLTFMYMYEILFFKGLRGVPYDLDLHCLQMSKLYYNQAYSVKKYRWIYFFVSYLKMIIRPLKFPFECSLILSFFPFFLQKTYFSLNKTVLNVWSGKTCKIL